MGLLSFLTILIMLGVAYSFWREGIFTAFIMLCNVFLAGLVAFGYWEPLANQLEPMLSGGPVQGLEDSLCLVLLFSITLGILRIVTNAIAYTDMKFQGGLLRIGGAV